MLTPPGGIIWWWFVKMIYDILLIGAQMLDPDWLCGDLQFWRRATSVSGSQNHLIEKIIFLLILIYQIQKFAEKSDWQENCGKPGESDLL